MDMDIDCREKAKVWIKQDQKERDLIEEAEQIEDWKDQIEEEQKEDIQQ